MESQRSANSQAVRTCQICRKDKRIKWKCFDCLVYMCEQCKSNVHSEIKTERRHIIVDVDPNQPPIDAGSLPCRNHGNKVCCVYCLKCEEFICPKCLTRFHQRHKFEEIENFHTERLKSLQDLADVEIVSDTHSEISSSDLSSAVSTVTGEIRFKIIKTYRTEINFVYRIVAINDTVLFSCLDNNFLGQIKLHGGRRLETYSTFHDISVCDMARTESGKLFLTCVGDSCLYRLSDFGKMTLCRDFGPFLPLAVHVTEENIIVSTRDKGVLFVVTRESRRQIVFLDQNGRKQVRVIEDNMNGRPLFSLVYRITTTPKKDIVVIDRLLDNGTGRILSLSNRKIYWIYRGCSKINTIDTPFVPLDIVTTSLGNIIIAEAANHVLHFLSPWGHLLNICMTKQMGIVLPMSLYIDNKEKLWIGCGAYKKAADKAKMHVIEISGC